MSSNNKFQGNHFGKSTSNVIRVSCSQKVTKSLRSKLWINLAKNRNIVIFWVTVTNISTSERKLRRKIFKGLRGALD